MRNILQFWQTWRGERSFIGKKQSSLAVDAEQLSNQHLANLEKKIVKAGLSEWFLRFGVSAFYGEKTKSVT